MIYARTSTWDNKISSQDIFVLTDKWSIISSTSPSKSSIPLIHYFCHNNLFTRWVVSNGGSVGLWFYYSWIITRQSTRITLHHPLSFSRLSLPPPLFFIPNDDRTSKLPYLLPHFFLSLSRRDLPVREDYVSIDSPSSQNSMRFWSGLNPR